MEHWTLCLLLLTCAALASLHMVVRVAVLLREQPAGAWVLAGALHVAVVAAVHLK